MTSAAKVSYDGAPRPALATTPVDSVGPPAAEKHPWECDHPEWLELYRYFAFLQVDVAGEAIQHDTPEPPRTVARENGAAEAKAYMPPEEFDVAKHGETHYTTTPPEGSEVVFQCVACAHAEPVKVPAAAAAKLAAKYESGELMLPHFSQLTLKELLGIDLAPGAVNLPAPEVPEWADEQRQMIRRISAGLPPIEVVP